MKKYLTVILLLVMVFSLTGENTSTKTLNQTHHLTAIIQKSQYDVKKQRNKIKHIQDTATGGEQLSYEDYRCVSDTSSPNYVYSQLKSYTDKYGLRKINNRYCVALASNYGTKIGTKYKAKLSTGKTLHLILTDQKANCDTYSNTVGKDGSLIEFVVDISNLHSAAKISGSISSIPGFGGTIQNITIED